MTFIIACPHCDQNIEVLETNCCIFRCGILKLNYKQIDPHLPKIKCEILIHEDLIFGCGKPFKIINENNKWISVVCDYI